jgi:alkanesulfonate monooxygenase SsuD/methylene tetrahydromethanopterin reductase-like flavin-dependent oxidoreductase (luciferase family)
MSNSSAVRVALVHSSLWTEITDAPPSGSVVRIHAADLREGQQARARARSEVAEAGKDADSVAVFLDIEIHIADDARTARREFAALNAPTVPGSIRYVGTPSGLAGLIADVKAAEVADGVTLIPLGPIDRTLDKVADGVVPWLEDRGVAFAADTALAAAGLVRPNRVLAS